MRHGLTLLCIDTVEHKLAKLAVENCINRHDFADVVIVSDKDLKIPGARWFHCETHNPAEIAALMWAGPLEFSRTSHTLMIQYDSWIINPHLWTDDFVKYDYIGAPWFWVDWAVGNGGFSIRSARLCEALAAEGAQIGYPEDAVLSRGLRPMLEDKYGMRWAPPDLAMRFALENAPFTNMSWGMHGGFMCRFVLGDKFGEWVLQSTGHFLTEHDQKVGHAERYLAAHTLRKLRSST